MSGLEILGAVGVSLQLAKAATICLSTVLEIRRVALLSREQNDAHFTLIVEAYKFEKWCSALGIQEVPKGNTKNQQPRKAQQLALRGTVQTQLRLENPMLEGWTVVALQDMGEKFASATKILSQYGANSTAEPEPNPEHSSNSSLLQPPKTKTSSMWGKFRRKEQQPSPSPTPPGTGHSSVSDLSTQSRGTASVVLRGKWVTSDKSKIEKTNELLVSLLDPAAQAQVGRQTDMTILDRVDHETIAESGTASSRPDLGAMARIKLWQMQEQKRDHAAITDSDDGLSIRTAVSGSGMEKPQPPGAGRVHPYQIRDFGRGTLPHGEYRTLTMLEDKQVLVEWKHYSENQPIRLGQTLRLGGLVGLLNRSQLYERFMTLPCQGLVDDSDNSRIGIVFSTNESNNNTKLTTRLRSLQKLINDEETPLPVGQRFELAKSLVAAVHHLHSVDWLHKSIRSDNVVSFWTPDMRSRPAAQTSISTTGVSVPSTVREHSQEDIDVQTHNVHQAPLPTVSTAPPPMPPFYLVGWDLSRPDHPMELSETVSISTAGYQNRRDTIQMYSHPSMHPSQADPSQKLRYRAEFDIYSLGLVLLEIGLWRTLAMLRGKCKTDSEFRARLVSEYCDRLPPKMGEIYWDVVRRCLSNDFGLGAGDGFDLKMAFESLVVSQLDKCRA
jgi:serine/threonine protein kinase